MSTKTQLYRVGIVRLQHLCSQSRAAKRAKTKLLQESACDSVIRDQKIRPVECELPAVRLAQSDVLKSRLLQQQGLVPKCELPPNEPYDAPRRRMKEGFVASFAFIIFAVRGSRLKK